MDKLEIKGWPHVLPEFDCLRRQIESDIEMRRLTESHDYWKRTALALQAEARDRSLKRVLRRLAANLIRRIKGAVLVLVGRADWERE